MTSLFDLSATPPRSVPLNLHRQVLNGGFVQVAWWILLFSTPFFWIFTAHADLVSWLLMRPPLARAIGVVTAVEQSRFRTRSRDLGTRHIARIRYRFALGAREYRGASYTEGTAPLGVGREVEVEYHAGRPSFSRIVGMRAASMPGAVGLIPVALLIAGLLWLRAAFRFNRKKIELLTHGLLTKGCFIKYAPAAKWPGTRLLFEVAGQKKAGLLVSAARSYHAKGKYLRAGDERHLLYLPGNPQEAILREEFPQSADSESRPALVPIRSGCGYHLILPFLVLGLNAGLAVAHTRDQLEPVEIRDKIGTAGQEVPSTPTPAADGELPTSPAELARTMVPQQDPARTLRLELAMMRLGVYLFDLPLFDPAWRRLTESIPSASLKRTAQRYNEKEHPYQVRVREEQGVIYYENRPHLGPVFLDRTASGWILNRTLTREKIHYTPAADGWFADDGDYPHLRLLKEIFAMDLVTLDHGGKAWKIKGP